MYQAIHLTDLQAAIAWNAAILLAAIIALGFQWSEGHRRGFEPLTWLTVLAVTYAALILGERAGSFTAAGWYQLLTSGRFPLHGGKTILGSLILAIPVFLLLKKWWRLPAGMADALVLALPLAAAAGRMGCLAAGCCFGSPTSGDWGLCYGPGAPAFGWQVAQGMIPPDATVSLPTYPVQLFFTIANLLAFALAWRLRLRFTTPGSLALLVLALLTGTRFWLEFFREAASNQGFLGETFGGVKAAQWACLAMAAAALTIFWRNQHRHAPQPSPSTGAGAEARTDTPRDSPRLVEISLTAKAGALLVVSLGGLLFSTVLTLEEEAILVLACAPALFFLTKKLHERWSSGTQERLPAALLSAAAFSLLATPLDTFPPMELGKRWIEIGAGGTAGAYADIRRDCDGNVVEQHKIKGNSFNFDGSFNWGLKNGRVGLGLRGSSGATKGAPAVADKVYKYTAFGGYAMLDKKAIGFRPGILFVSTDAAVVTAKCCPPSTCGSGSSAATTPTSPFGTTPVSASTLNRLFPSATTSASATPAGRKTFE